MKILSAEFIKSAVEISHYPDESLPEIAFAGRSNVGKSSLINSLLNRKSLVKVSSSPGKTRLINFFKINSQFSFVDLPGYGFARVPPDVKNKWGKMVETYLKKRKNLMTVVLIFDIRHAPTDNDKKMLEWLDYYQIQPVFIANKSDKIKKRERSKQVQAILHSLNKPDGRAIVYSSKKKEGIKDLWKVIEQAISGFKKLP